MVAAKLKKVEKEQNLFLDKYKCPICNKKIEGGFDGFVLHLYNMECPKYANNPN